VAALRGHASRSRYDLRLSPREPGSAGEPLSSGARGGDRAGRSGSKSGATTSARGSSRHESATGDSARPPPTAGRSRASQPPPTAHKFFPSSQTIRSVRQAARAPHFPAFVEGSPDLAAMPRGRSRSWISHCAPGHDCKSNKPMEWDTGPSQHSPSSRGNVAERPPRDCDEGCPPPRCAKPCLSKPPPDS
jgi:hypothetical protein